MGRRFLFAIAGAFMLAMGSAGCVNTTLQTDWKDPGFRGTFRKVLVICLAQEMVVRNTLEDDLTTQFTARGVDAIPSYTFFPSLEGVTRDMIKTRVRETSADGVFLVRPIGKDTMQISHAGENWYAGGNWYDHWESYSQGGIHGSTVNIYRVETSLYETTGNKIVWGAVSDTFEGGPWMNTLKEFAQVMGAKLIERGLI